MQVLSKPTPTKSSGNNAEGFDTTAANLAASYLEGDTRGGPHFILSAQSYTAPKYYVRVQWFITALRYVVIAKWMIIRENPLTNLEADATGCCF